MKKYLIVFGFVVIFTGISVVFYLTFPKFITENDSVEEVGGIKEVNFSVDEVSLNNTKDSCWTVVEGNVYDITDFIAKHPGGEDKIILACGTDATGFFNGTNPLGRVHSIVARNILSSYKIGSLDTSN